MALALAALDMKVAQVHMDCHGLGEQTLGRVLLAEHLEPAHSDCLQALQMAEDCMAMPRVVRRVWPELMVLAMAAALARMRLLQMMKVAR